MDKLEKYSDKDWEKIASLISGETNPDDDLLKKFEEEDHLNTERLWKEIGNMEKDKNIDVDKAWNNICSRIEDNRLIPVTEDSKYRLFSKRFIKIAAIVLVIIGLGATALYIVVNKPIASNTVIATNADQRNKEVTLPDGSKVYLNRNSQLSYDRNSGKFNRKVTLKGEAFFDVSHNPAEPFIIDAGNANVKVLGTSFSVLTNNSKNAVEVFVKTGKVMLTNSTGSQILTLEPGFIGTVDQHSSSKSVNGNPNYLSWNTDLLVYDGKKLDIVFADLKKVFNIEVVADNPEILDASITTTFEKEPEETIIRIICSTFNFSYKKEGPVYHLSKR